MGSNRALYEQMRVAREWRAYDLLWRSYDRLWLRLNILIASEGIISNVALRSPQLSMSVDRASALLFYTTAKIWCQIVRLSLHISGAPRHKGPKRVISAISHKELKKHAW